MSKMCIHCRKILPDDGVCSCQRDAQKTTGNNASSSSRQTSDSQAQINAKVDEAMKKTTALLGSVFAFFKVFMKQPVTAMQENNIKTSETLFFVILQPFSLFLLLLVIAAQINAGIASVFGYLGGYAFQSLFGDWIGMLLKTFVFGIGSLAALLIISVIFGKFIFKGNLDLNKLFTLTVISQIPLTFSYILSIVFILFSAQLAVLALTFGVISSIVIGTFVFVASFDISFDKCVYCSVFTYSAQTVVLGLLLAGIMI